MSEINPSTGLPTVNGYGSTDVSGTPYGSSKQNSSTSNWKNSGISSSSTVVNLIVGIVLLAMYVGWIYILLK